MCGVRWLNDASAWAKPPCNEGKIEWRLQCLDESLFAPPEKIMGDNIGHRNDAPVPESPVMCPESDGEFSRYELLLEHLFVFAKAAVLPDHHGFFRASHVKELGMLLNGREAQIQHRLGTELLKAGAAWYDAKGTEHASQHMGVRQSPMCFRYGNPCTAPLSYRAAGKIEV